MSPKYGTSRHCFHTPEIGRGPTICGTLWDSQLAKARAAYDRSEPGAARVAASDFAGTSRKLFWPETLVYLLPGVELNQMLTLGEDMKLRHLVNLSCC